MLKLESLFGINNTLESCTSDFHSHKSVIADHNIIINIQIVSFNQELNDKIVHTYFYLTQISYDRKSFSVSIFYLTSSTVTNKHHTIPFSHELFRKIELPFSQKLFLLNYKSISSQIQQLNNVHIH
jgi:hypothetical protein